MDETTPSTPTPAVPRYGRPTRRRTLTEADLPQVPASAPQSNTSPWLSLWGPYLAAGGAGLLFILALAFLLPRPTPVPIDRTAGSTAAAGAGTGVGPIASPTPPITPTATLPAGAFLAMAAIPATWDVNANPAEIPAGSQVRPTGERRGDRCAVGIQVPGGDTNAWTPLWAACGAVGVPEPTPEPATPVPPTPVPPPPTPWPTPIPTVCASAASGAFQATKCGYDLAQLQAAAQADVEAQVQATRPEGYKP